MIQLNKEQVDEVIGLFDRMLTITGFPTISQLIEQTAGVLNQLPNEASAPVFDVVKQNIAQSISFSMGQAMDLFKQEIKKPETLEKLKASGAIPVPPTDETASAGEK